MSCEKLHRDELFKTEYGFCPFCCLQTRKIDNKNIKITHCCGQEISEIHCIIYGQIYYDIYKNNYIDFYENMYKIRKESVYIRKYHIINVLDEISLSNE